MSTMFIDRQPMGPHDLIQAFSRTNRIYDKNKTYGQIVTFQAPKLFKERVDHAVKLYSAPEEYDDYAGHYFNVIEEIKAEKADRDPNGQEEDTVIDEDYELMAYSNTKIDYEYIIHLIQNIVTPDDEEEEITPEERQKKIDEVKQYVEELNKENPKIAQIMSDLITEIEKDEEKYKGQSILHIVEDTKQDCIDQVITDFCYRWFASKEDIMYAATHYRNGEIPNESAIRTTVDYASYKKAQEKAIPKFKYYAKLFEELRKTLDEEIEPLMIS